MSIVLVKLLYVVFVKIRIYYHLSYYFIIIALGELFVSFFYCILRNKMPTYLDGCNNTQIQIRIFD
jgi:hypothetical protein